MRHAPLILEPTISSIESEQALVWAFRQWVCGHIQGRACHWQLAWQRLSDLLGQEDGTRAVVALEAMVRVICRHALRPISYHEPPCPCIGADERRIMSVVAACQRSAWKAAASSAERLIDAEGTGELIGAAARIGTLFAEHDQHFPLDHERAPSPTPQKGQRTPAPSRLH